MEGVKNHDDRAHPSDAAERDFDSDLHDDRSLERVGVMFLPVQERRGIRRCRAKDRRELEQGHRCPPALAQRLESITRNSS